MFLPVAPCAFLGRFERYWASYKKWKVREGEEIEGRKPSWPWRNPEIRKHDRWCHGWSTLEYGRGETLKCRWFFSSVRGVNGSLVGFPIRRSIWPIAGEFLNCAEDFAKVYHEPKWLPTFHLFCFPSPSTSYNSLNNARNGSGFHMEQQEKTLYK